MNYITMTTNVNKDSKRIAIFYGVKDDSLVPLFPLIVTRHTIGHLCGYIVIPKEKWLLVSEATGVAKPSYVGIAAAEQELPQEIAMQFDFDLSFIIGFDWLESKTTNQSAVFDFLDSVARTICIELMAQQK